jgi:tetratricopeptide (TPR) repeat protein
MKSILTSSLLALLAVSILAESADAAKARRRSGGGGGGGGGGSGVFLNTPDPRNPLEHNNRGVELGSKGLWPDAIREHETALMGDPNNKTFRTNLSAAQLRYGDMLMNKGDLYNAMKQFRGALYVDPGNNPAEDHLDECLRRGKKDPYSLAVRLRIAEDSEISGDYETAIVEYRRCVKISDDGPTHAKLGKALMKANKTVDGFAELKLAVSKNWEAKDKVELAECHMRLGDILKEFAFVAKKNGKGSIGMRRLMNAGTAYRRAVTINDANADAKRSFVEVAREAVAIRSSFDNYLMLGGAYLLLDDFEHAKIAYEQCYKIDPRNTALAPARIALHQRIARSPMASPALVQESIGKVKKSLEVDPQNARWWYILGRLQEHQANNDEALNCYNKAKEINQYIDPDLKSAFARLGDSAAASQIGDTGQPAGPTGGTVPTPGAAPAAGAPPVVTAAPKKPPKSYAAIEKALTAGDVDGSLKMLEEALTKDPTDGHAYALKAGIHQKKGELAEAASDYRQALAFNEPEAESALRQVNLLRVQPMMQNADKFSKDGNWVKAAEELREGINIAPGLSILHRKLADALRQLGDPKEAEKEMAKANELDKQPATPKADTPKLDAATPPIPTAAK